MALINSLASRLGIGQTKSLLVQPMRGAAIIGSFLLDACEVQSLTLPTSITDHPVGGDDLTDNIRHGPPELVVSGWIGTTSITFGPIGKAIRGLTVPIAGANPGFVDGNQIGLSAPDADIGAKFPAGRAAEIFQELVNFRASKTRFLCTMSWLQLENMAIARVGINRTVDSGDAIPVSLTFRRIRVVSSAQVSSIVADTDASARGAGGTADLGGQGVSQAPPTLPPALQPLNGLFPAPI